MTAKTLVSLCAIMAIGCVGPSSGIDGLIRVGYFPNITHSQAVIGMQRGDFAEALSPGTEIEVTIFNAGPSVIEAIYAGHIDIAYIGPNPAISGFVRSRGEAVRIIAGATSGGASLVVRPEAGIRNLADLDGTRIATPQLGNTQDVALRQCLSELGMKPSEEGGTVQIVPTPNPQILDLFRQGQIDGAWVPEPWATRLVIQGGGEVLLDERDLWPGGDFVTAHVIVSTPFLEARPELVKQWLQTHVDITLWINSNPDEAVVILNTGIENLTGAAIPDDVLQMAMSRMRVTYDPVSFSLVESAGAAWRSGFLESEPDLDGIYSLSILNSILTERGMAAVECDF